MPKRKLNSELLRKEKKSSTKEEKDKASSSKEKTEKKSSTKEKGSDPGFEITGSPPTRNKKGQLVFDDAPDFR